MGRKLMQFFLLIVLRCFANHKTGKVMDILKCILWDFVKKTGYFKFISWQPLVRKHSFGP